jgi:hypothetical protein
MGLVSLQGLLLLLEVGRSRKEKGLPFILALEEPELHLARFAPTDIFVMSASSSSAMTVPFLAKPLDASATNNDRKLFVQNRVRVLDSLMHPVVLVPEGRFDAEWLSRLADIAETPSIPPFGTVCGIAPTENAAVAFTTRVLRTLRRDADGGAYALALAALSNRPEAIVQWPVDWTIENVVGWIVAAGGAPAIARIQSGLGSSWKIGTVRGTPGT